MKKVSIVGAGLSGCMAAIAANEKGYDVNLIEARDRDVITRTGRTSFEALQNLTSNGDALLKLSKLGINLEPEYLYKAAKVHGPSGAAVDIRMEEPHGYFVRRGARGSIDSQMIGKVERSGIDIDFGTRVVEANNDGLLIIKKNDIRKKTEADIIIGADGLGSVVGRKMLPPLRRKEIAVGIGYHYRGSHDFEPGTAECFLGSRFCPGEYAYVLPTEDEATIVTTMRPHLMENGINPVHHLQRFLETPEVKDRMGDMEVVNRVSGGVPVKAGSQLGDGKILLVGEAARLTDPVLGFGIVNAVTSGKLASSCLGEQDPLAEYRSLMDSLMIPDLRSRLGIRESILDRIDDRDLDRVVDVIATIEGRVGPDLFFNKRTRKTAFLKALPSLIRSGGVRTATRYLVPFLYSNYSLQ